MKREHIIRFFAGTLVLVGLLFGTLVSPWWLLICAFVGLNLVQSSFTKWCLLENILKKYNIGSEV